MAFPVVASTSSGNSAANATSTVITMPSGAVTGDLVIVVIQKDDSVDITISSGTGWASGWETANGATRNECFWKVLDGTGDNLTLAHDNEGTAYVAYRITGHDSGTNPAFGTPATGSSANPAPPTLNPAGWDVEDTLWIVAYGWDANVAHSSYPTDYASNQVTDRWANTGGCGVAIASRELAAASVTPGTATIASSTAWVANTIAVRADTSAPITVLPGTGELTLTGFAPTVAATQNVVVAAGLGELTLTGFAPTAVASDHKNVAAGLGELTLTGFAPTVSVGAPIEVLPGTGELTLTGFAPTVAATAHQNVLPGLGELTLTGFAPTVNIGVNVQAGRGELVLEGFAPTVAVTAHQNALPGLGEITLTGFAPTVVASNPQNVLPGLGELTLEGFAPTVAVSTGTSVSPGTGALVVTGYAPTISITRATYWWVRTA